MADIDKMAVFETGVGVIEPTGRYTETEIVQSVEESQKPVEDPAVVCMDERRDIREPQPVREKVAGGNLCTFLHGAAAVEWTGFTKGALEAGPEQLVEDAADFLVASGETLGGHRHAHPGSTESKQHDKKSTGCGAVDKADKVDVDIVEHADDDEWVDAAKTDLGELFNADDYETARAGHAKMVEDENWRKWERGRIQEVVEKRDGVVELLDEDSDAFADESDDNAHQRHGHWAEVAKINKDDGKSNDRDNARIPAFQVDVAPIVRMAKAAATSEREFSRLLHSMYLRQLGTTYRLTRNMNIIR
ncbi:hypothetical protein KC951_00350 [Candidatus Saccharibacteria bacterium]|nr:hypothetical protein [Candidatus Saccharibacteria bacterium]